MINTAGYTVKGATPDDNGLVIIPGSRGDYSWLVKPVANEKTLHSLAHGAGREWGRTECKGRLAAKYTATQLSRTDTWQSGNLSR